MLRMMIQAVRLLIVDACGLTAAQWQKMEADCLKDLLENGVHAVGGDCSPGLYRPRLIDIGCPDVPCLGSKGVGVCTSWMPCCFF